MRDAKLDFTWSLGGFDNIMLANFTIHNPTQFRFKEVEVKCVHFAPSGTVIDSNTRTIYQLFEAHSTKKLEQFDMGFINQQVKSSVCHINDLVVFPEG